MKKTLVALTALSLLLILCSCSNAPSLDGNWQAEITAGSTTIPVDMSITGNQVEVKMNTGESGQSFVLWTGTYTAPTSDTQPYKWTSESEDGKTTEFTYDNDKITGNLTFMGLTRELTFSRVESNK